ncbi:MAG: bifunctional phosphoribosylaminoimidazolecarboxamide formyltransferase/IMP cyclohydrolase [Candidatus Omnitrophica bacterium]|nr:bifunctional phosphoribosylaminoimidazolecarboxamide formyltransferase/IMP cyclohydrolase [Candidatus Omnitrophota bacterium]MBU4487947.1 bifunctional phosphoribosylaminoimidazolecarboxamide formyltransferase/IMP cyclohydrolase [Candidatus Omnitrophota bacterium]MCG2705068.1 bifunctional phosphoribosylaminoimidazolecarboxamide formyltransferase/IMP cyclohydrolase [Candidatus Omnitrophota bacterium]
MKVKRALISVSDKTGLEDLVKTLAGMGVEILSTGGTAKFIRSLGVKVAEVSDYTGSPEIMDGRVKTLHPKIHGALLALRDNREHMAEAKKHGIIPIDMVVVNLYPFAKTVAQKTVKLEEAVENIDIGGPSMLRSAAKNFVSVAVLSDPTDYPEVIEELKRTSGSLSEESLSKLAAKTFKRTSEYDSLISGYLSGISAGASGAKQSVFPDKLALEFEKIEDLRYGENPHQKAAFYRNSEKSSAASLTKAKKLHGKDLSFNNIMDLDAALDIVSEFDEPAACIIKHATPCGVALGKDLKSAFQDALDCDKLSAFGGIIGLNKALDEKTAIAIAEAGFIECIIAPSYDKKGLEALTKKKNLRLMEAGDIKSAASGREYNFKKLRGGALFQEVDAQDAAKKDLKCVTKKRPTTDELDSLYFAWKVVKHVKSNAIVISRDKKTVGIGAGQTSRIDSVIIAINKAGERARNAVLASEAFFPKADSIEAAAKAGICAIIQPGGSIADQEIIDAADKFGISMVFTLIRHFSA